MRGIMAVNPFLSTVNGLLRPSKSNSKALIEQLFANAQSSLQDIRGKGELEGDQLLNTALKDSVLLDFFKLFDKSHEYIMYNPFLLKLLEFNFFASKEGLPYQIVAKQYGSEHADEYKQSCDSFKEAHT